VSREISAGGGKLTSRRREADTIAVEPGPRVCYLAPP
jgi:hypothetical protein